MLLRPRFKAALLLSGLTQTDWARQQGVSPMAVHQLVYGHMMSARLLVAMHRFIAAQLPHLAPEHEAEAARILNENIIKKPAA